MQYHYNHITLCIQGERSNNIFTRTRYSRSLGGISPPVFYKMHYIRTIMNLGRVQLILTPALI
jgi:hypothetical protein